MIKNNVNGKCYIGSTKDLKERWYVHKSALDRGKHHSPHLQRAWDKYGPDAFTLSVVEYVENDSDLISCEQFWIDHHRASERAHGYNISSQALRTQMSEEGRKRWAEAMKGRVSPMKGKHHTDEAKRKLSEASKGNTNRRGSTHTEEAKRKMSESHKGQKAWNKGIPNSPEATAKWRETMIALGHLTPEGKRVVNLPTYKGEWSEERRRKYRETMIARGYMNPDGKRIWSEESNQKRRDTLLARHKKTGSQE